MNNHYHIFQEIYIYFNSETVVHEKTDGIDISGSMFYFDGLNVEHVKQRREYVELFKIDMEIIIETTA